METTKKVIQTVINHILLHVKPHWDEIVAVWLLQTFGLERYPGIGTAKKRYTKGVEPKSDKIFDMLKMLPVGCGQGRFDEHRPGLKDAQGESTDRIPGECATTLVAKDLGLMEMSVVKRIAEEALRCDTEAGVGITEMPNVVKAMHRRLEDGNETVLEWATKGLRATSATLEFNFAKVAGEKTLQGIFNELDKDERFPDQRSRNSLASMVGKSQSKLDKSEKESTPAPILELAFVVSALQRTDIVPTNDIIDWVMFPLAHLYNDQTEFWAAVDEAKTPHIGRVAERLNNLQGGKEKEGVKVLIIHSDNQLVAKASRVKEVGADVTIVRDSTGRIYVTVDSHTELSLGNYVRMIRWYELPKDGNGKPVNDVSWADLGVEGAHPLVPHIYFFKNSIINGGPTHPDVAPVGVASQTLLNIARAAFSKRHTILWMKEHGIFKVNKPLNNVGEAVESAKETSATEENPPTE